MNRRLREFHWRWVKKALFSEEILTSIRILKGNRLQVQTTTWEDYRGENTQYFSEESLQMPDGQNLLSRLCALGKYVIIEDVDLGNCIKITTAFWNWQPGT